MKKSILMLTAIVVSFAPVAAEDPIKIGAKRPKAMPATIVVDGLSNPSGVAFSPTGNLTICESGAGIVHVVKDGKPTPFVTGFATEYWKVDAETGTKRFKLGPLSAVWVNESTLAVTNAGLGDGEETILFFDGPGTAADGKATNSVGPTSDDAKDKGEGNLTGLSVTEDGSTLFVAGQGSDAKTWVLKVDTASHELSGAFSADEAGIEINSPMDTIAWNKNSVLALYSGAGGKDDGLIVQWNIRTGEVMKQWTLPGLTDPMGFARIPGSGQLVVVDNNWSLTEVKAGRLARVSIPRMKEEATVRILADKLSGPVSCKFGPDGRLYIAQLGKEFDKTLGQVIAVDGIKAMGRKKKPEGEGSSPTSEAVTISPDGN